MVIVAAIDGVDGSTTVLSEAEKLADSFGEPLHVIFVYEESEHSHLANRFMNVTQSMSDDRAEELADEVVADAAADIAEEYETVGRAGSPAEEILEYVDEVAARYVVVGGRSRSPAGKALFGSVTQSVLLEASCPVLVTMAEE